MNILNLIDRALSPVVADDTEPYTAVSRKIIEVSGVDLGTKSDREALRKFRDDYAAGLQVTRTFNYASAHKAFIEHRKDLEKSVATGEINSIDGYGEAEIELEHIQKLEAGKAACRGAARACLPVARKIAEQFAGIADKFAAVQEKQERDVYAKFGLKYPGASPLLELLKTASEWAVAKVPQEISAAGCGPNPETMLPYFDF